MLRSPTSEAVLPHANPGGILVIEKGSSSNGRGGDWGTAADPA